MNKRLSPEEFIKIWQGASSPKDAMAKMGGKAPAVNSRVARYRKLGIPLKRFSASNELLNVKDLAKLAKSLE